MNDFVVIFIYTTKNDITIANLESIKRNNPNTTVIDICQDDFKHSHYDFLDLRPIKHWKPDEIWFWGSDNIFLHWYLEQQSIRAKNYLILEWDTYIHNISINDFFGNNIEKNTGISCVALSSADKHPWNHWFRYQHKHALLNKFYTQKNLHCCTPLCATIISDDCTKDIIKHIKNYWFANKIYVETKFITLASYLGYNIKSIDIPDLSSYISFDPNVVISKLNQLSDNGKHSNFKGIFHPVKNTEIIRKYFMNKEQIDRLNENYKIHKAVYGTITDVKHAIETLLSIAPEEKIEINNFLNGDPAPGVNKELYLTYEKNGQIYETVIPEREFLDIKNL